MAKILVIDDDPINLDVLFRALSRFSHEVQVAGSAEQGYELYKKAKADGKPFELILTDQNLGGMSGNELGTEIRKTDPDVKLIRMTGLHDPLPEGVFNAHFTKGELRLLAIMEMISNMLSGKQDDTFGANMRKTPACGGKSDARKAFNGGGPAPRGAKLHPMPLLR